jgi:hypothetical protein
MSVQMVSQKIKKTCEGCGVEKIYEMIEEPSAETIKELENWYTLVREMLVPDGRNGAKYEKFMVQAHEPACVPVALLKLMKLGVTVEEPADEIDLASLQQDKPYVQ